MIDLNLAWEMLSDKGRFSSIAWQMADEYRSSGGRDLNQGLLELELGETQTEESDSTRLLEALLPTIEGGVRHTYEWQSHRALVEFVSSFAESLKPAPESIIDPVCGFGMLLAASARAVQAETVHGVEIKEAPLKFAAEVLGDSATLIHGNCLAPDDRLLDKYDLIVAEPPHGVRLSEDEAASIGITAKSLAIDHALVLWAASRLTDEGSALVTVSPSFFFHFHAKQLREAVWASGCRIAAAIHIPREVSRPRVIGPGGYLLLLERGEQEELFVGQLSVDPEKQEQLLSNLIRRKLKGPPALGRYCSLSEFAGFEALVAQESLNRLAKTLNWAGHPADRLFTSVEPLSRVSEDTPAEDENSLFLNLSSRLAFRQREDAEMPVSDRRQGSTPLNSILHLKVDPSVASSEFMVHWFNDTRIGNYVFGAHGSLSIFQRIRKRELLASTIYLPPVADQALFVEGAAYLGQLRAEVAELESQLWDGPEPVADTVERIRSHNREDRYEDWFETLPFPLARVLWKHHASSGSHQERYKTLLHFFEATAAFLATVQLSAFMADDELWMEVGPELNKKLSQQNLSLDQASFGSWRVVFEFLSKRCEDLIKESAADGEQPRAQQMFRVVDTRSLGVLTDSRLRNILQQANKIRNDWDGHGGAMSEASAKDVHDRLYALVQQTREVFGRKWQAFELIQPGTIVYRNELFSVTSNRLMGTRCNPFEERVYESEDPLETGGLYLFDSVSRRGLKLLPFVTVMPSPEQSADACYVLSRAGNDGNSRWVSYHFEQESQINLEVEGVSEALERFTQFTGGAFFAETS